MFALSPLPYATDALEPTISKLTMETHYGKHHRKYVDNLNDILANHASGPFASLEDVIRHAETKGEKKLFNNAAQTWNHAFFWESMTANYGAPTGALAAAIERDFGGLDGLKARFVDEGVNHFASGWAWLVARGGKLEVISTHDAATALTGDSFPILTCDVWEHAYYLDHKQDRKGFIEGFFDRLANWDFAARQLEASMTGEGGYAYPKPTA